MTQISRYMVDTRTNRIFLWNLRGSIIAEKSLDEVRIVVTRDSSRPLDITYDGGTSTIFIEGQV